MKKQSFVLRLSQEGVVEWEKGDIVTASGNHRCKIIKVYRYNLWRRFLKVVFGIKFWKKDCYKVKYLYD